MQLKAGFLTRSVALLALRECEHSENPADGTPRAIQVCCAGAAVLDLLNLGYVRLQTNSGHGLASSSQSSKSPQLTLVKSDGGSGIAFLDSALSILSSMPGPITLHDGILRLSGAGAGAASGGVRFIDLVVDALCKEGLWEKIEKGPRFSLLLKDTASLEELHAAIWAAVNTGEESPLVMIVLALCKSAQVDSRGRSLLGKLPAYRQHRALFARRIKPFLRGVVVDAVRQCVQRARAMDEEAEEGRPAGRAQQLARTLRRHGAAVARVARRIVRGLSCRRRPPFAAAGPSFSRLPAAPAEPPRAPRDPFWSWSMDYRDATPQAFLCKADE